MWYPGLTEREDKGILTLSVSAARISLRSYLKENETRVRHSMRMPRDFDKAIKRTFV